MGKLKLNLDDLKVESFATTPESPQRPGTVFGQAEGTWATCQGMETCAPYNTCAGMGCGSEEGTCYGCIGGSQNCPTQWNTCGCGWTALPCTTAGNTDCPDQTECGPPTGAMTCYNSCTDANCTACGMVC